VGALVDTGWPRLSAAILMKLQLAAGASTAIFLDARTSSHWDAG